MSSNLCISERLVDFYTTLQRQDRDLEWDEIQSQRADFDDASRFEASGKTLDQLAIDFAKAFPDQEVLAKRLNDGARRIIADAGQVYAMAQSNATYGSGWGEQWNPVLDTVRRAIDTSVPHSVLAARMVDCYGDLQRNDRDLEWDEAQAQRADFSDADRFARTGKALDELARDFRMAHPDQASLADALDAAARRVVADAGQVYGMAQIGERYGSGWGKQWDGVLANVRQAIGHLFDTQTVG